MGGVLRAQAVFAEVLEPVEAWNLDFELQRADAYFPGLLTIGILRAADARRTAGDSAAELPVRRSWARVELTLLVVLAVATVVALVV